MCTGRSQDGQGGARTVRGDQRGPRDGWAPRVTGKLVDPRQARTPLRLVSMRLNHCRSRGAEEQRQSIGERRAGGGAAVDPEIWGPGAVRLEPGACILSAARGQAWPFALSEPCLLQLIPVRLRKSHGSLTR